MAEGTLTDYLPTPDRGKGIVPTSSGGSNIFAGLVNGIGDLTTALSTKAANDRADLRFKQASTEFGQAQGDRAAKNEMAGLLGGFDPSGVTPTQPSVWTGGAPAIDSSLQGVPDSVKQGAVGLQRTQVAVQQGNIPASTYQMKLEQFISQVARDHPDSQAAILTFLKEQGLSHWTTRIADQQAAAEDAQTQAKQQADADSYKVAASNNLLPDGASFEVGVALGRQRQGDLAQLAFNKASNEELTAAAALQSSNDTHQDHVQKQTDRSTLSSVMSIGSQQITAALDAFQTGVASVGTDPNRLNQVLTEIVPNAINSIEQMRRSATNLAIQAHAGPDVIDGINHQYDTYRDSFKTITIGDASQVAANILAVKNLEAQWGLQKGTAAVTYAALSNIYGQQTVNGVLTGQINSPWSSQMTAGLKAESSNLDHLIPGTADWSAELKNFSDIASGKIKITSLSESDAQKTIPHLIATSKGNAVAVAQGDKTATGRFSSSLGAVEVAVHTIQPGFQDMGVLTSASTTVADRNARAAIDQMIKDPTTHQQGLELATATRASSARLIEVLKNAGPMQDGTGAVKIVQAPDGHYTAKFDQAGYDAYVRNYNGNTPVVQAGLTGGFGVSQAFRDQPLSKDIVLQSGQSDLAHKVTLLNLNLDNIVALSHYDDNLPKMTTNQLRTYYSTGQLPEGVKLPTTVNGEMSDQAFQTWESGMSQRFRELPTQISQNNPETRTNHPQGQITNTPIINQVADEVGMPHEVASLIAGHESSFDPLADVRKTKPKGWENSHAAGLFQVQPGLAKKAGLHVNVDPATGSPLPDDERLNPYKNAQVGLGEFKRLLILHHGDVAAAAHDYSGGQWNASFVKELTNAFTRAHFTQFAKE